MDENQGTYVPSEAVASNYFEPQKFTEAQRHHDKLNGHSFHKQAPVWIDYKQLKGIVGKSRSTIYRWIDKGHLPAPSKALGTQNMWRTDEVYDYMNRFKKSPLN